MEVSDLFLFCSGREKGGSPRRQEGGKGDRFLIENPRRGGGSRSGRGREGVCGELGNFFWGGGLNFFFRGRNVHQVFFMTLESDKKKNLKGQHNLKRC